MLDHGRPGYGIPYGQGTDIPYAGNGLPYGQSGNHLHHFVEDLALYHPYMEAYRCCLGFCSAIVTRREMLEDGNPRRQLRKEGDSRG